MIEQRDDDENASDTVERQSLIRDSRINQLSTDGDETPSHNGA